MRARGAARDRRARRRRHRPRGRGDRSGDVPLLPLSTGTNNAFPEMWEATVAGTAAGLLATGRVDADDATHRAKVLHVECRAEPREIALVDVCVSTVTHVGSKALWQPATLRELYCAFAEPHAIGLSSIAGLLHPAARTDPHGVAVPLADPATAAATVLAPIAPGVVAPIGVRDAAPLRAGDAAPGRRRARHRRRRRRARDRVRPRPPPSPSPSRTTDPACSTCAPCSPPPPRAGSSSTSSLVICSDPAGGHDEGSTVPRSRRHPHRRRTRADRRPGAGEGRRRVVRHLRHRPARVPRRPDLHPAEGLAAPADRPGDAGGDGPRVRRRHLRGRRGRHEREGGRPGRRRALRRVRRVFGLRDRPLQHLPQARVRRARRAAGRVRREVRRRLALGPPARRHPDRPRRARRAARRRLPRGAALRASSRAAPRRCSAPARSGWSPRPRSRRRARRRSSSSSRPPSARPRRPARARTRCSTRPRSTSPDAIRDLTGGAGADVAFECAGIDAVLGVGDRLGAPRRHGRQRGDLGPRGQRRGERARVLRDQPHRHARLLRDHPATIGLLQDKKVDADQFITGRIGLDDLVARGSAS